VEAVKLHTLRAEQRLALSIGEAWSFLSDPRNLERITPASMRFEVTSNLPERIHPGLIVTYRVRPLAGIPVQWVTEITHVVEPTLFVDEQRFGPYRFWHHQHHLSEIAGGVLMTDIVHYALPRGAGALGNHWIVAPQLNEIFEHRRRVLEERFGSPP
jgi:ligand-binding SRPBCC domain-containing protein